MTDIIKRVHDLLSQKSLTQDVKIVEHHEKPDAPQRISIMIYGGRVGLAVVTLEKAELWKISDVKSDSHYHKVKWPRDVVGDASDEGALALIDLVLKSVVDLDQKRA